MSHLTTMTTAAIYCTVPHKQSAAVPLLNWVRNEIDGGHLGTGTNQLGAKSWICPPDLLQQVRDAAMLVQWVGDPAVPTRQMLQVPQGTQAAMLVLEWLVDVLHCQLPLPCGCYGAHQLALHIEALLAE